MELSLSGNALKTFARCITCLARIGNELAIQASPSQLACHTLNSSRSAYQSITFKPDFFDVFTISGTQVQCSVLLKAISAVLRTPLTSIDHLSVLLPDPDTSKVQWTLDCYNGGSQLAWDVWRPSLGSTLPRMPAIPCFRPLRSYHGMAGGGCEGCCSSQVSDLGDRIKGRHMVVEPTQGGLAKRSLKILNSSLQATYPLGDPEWNPGPCLKPRHTHRIVGIPRVGITWSWFCGITWSRFRGITWSMRKAYWITCNIEPDIQHLSLDRRKFPSSFVVRPRDLNRLLGNFQSTLQEITIIATEPSSLPSDAASEIGGKAVELRSYIDPTKDPAEEFVQYAHVGDPVDVTFGVKELKAFLSFCEGCEVDIHLYFEKAGEPILMAPKLGVDDGSTSNFDATLVLATMLISQLHEGNPVEPPAAAAMRHDQPFHGTGSQAQERTRGNVSEYPSDHTRIWSDISGSGAKSGNGVEERHVEGGRNPTTKELGEIQRMSTMHISEGRSDVRNMARDPNPYIMVYFLWLSERADMEGHGLSQHHPSWVDAIDVDADEDDDEGDEAELCVQSTPPYHEE
ncbi:cell cycle checkpoint control protein family [Actinidia rufa]|uniref:Cell cycle checkpoint control protein family n=1 Tax=Actinidia rufa TaxID=165716 RepID=A0A7J0EVZ4_9ERIC|nr:cell cycle checkpoint control protein family [Actinidia rufa]